jgi:hypothetical protein
VRITSTDSRSILRCPPGVFMAVMSPLSAYLRTVSRLTPSILAASAGLIYSLIFTPSEIERTTSGPF